MVGDHPQPHGVWWRCCTGVLLKGHPLIALRSQAGLAVVGQGVSMRMSVAVLLHGLVGGPGRSRRRRRRGAGVERHVAVGGGVVQAAGLEVRQVLEGRGAQGRAGGLQGEQVGSGARGQATRGAGQKAVRRVSLLRGRQLGAHQAGSVRQGHGHGGHSGEVQVFSLLLLHHD